MIINKEIPKSVINLISKEAAWKHKVVPFEELKDSIEVYSSVPNNDFSEEYEILCGKEVLFLIIEEDELTELLQKFYPKSTDDRAQVKQYNRKADDFLEVLIEEAKYLDSSDIHIEAYEERGRVRVRIDGKLIERYEIDKDLYPTLINKIKIKSRLDIAEKRLPQDGRIEYNDNGIKVDIRVSVLPTLHGEKVVMRLLNNDATNIDLSSLGLKKDELFNYLEGVRQPNGIILISGPTGSGKTTTLYATLKKLNKKDTNIVTIEDPIEYTLEGINQVQLKEDIGLDFKSALKSFLRQDPDVIMLGEIRDAETANMAIRAALTGHLVLSTIHTNSAWGTISRLIDMGVPPFLIASTLSTSVAQRLVRKLCPSCKEKQDSTPENLPPSFTPPFKIESYYTPKGCDDCYFTGYKGREAVYEVVSLDKQLGELIKNSIFDASKELKVRKIKSLSENAYELLAGGKTSIEEVYPILLNA
jgi:type IV pilus assembly protein PilB